MKSIWLIGVLVGFSTLTASGQTSGPVSFEVATIKPAVPGVPPFPGMPPSMIATLSEEMVRFQGGPGTKSPNRINYPGVTLKMLLKRAYNLGPRQIFGPDWLDTQRYDIVAQLPVGSDKEALRLMLQNLLAERFQMTLHRETRMLPVYLLTVAKAGPKFKVAKNDPAESFAAVKAANAASDAAISRDAALSGDDSPRIGFHMTSGSTSQLVEWLADHVDLPVQDRTKLDGFYAFALSWTPDDVLLSNPASKGGVSMFAALEDQLGLKLQKENAPVNVLVIDHADKVPTSN